MFFFTLINIIVLMLKYNVAVCVQPFLVDVALQTELKSFSLVSLLSRVVAGRTFFADVSSQTEGPLSWARPRMREKLRSMLGKEKSPISKVRTVHVLRKQRERKYYCTVVHCLEGH